MLDIKIQGQNEGVAPFSHPWPVQLALIDEAGKLAGRMPLDCDIRTWLPGPFRLEAAVKIDVPPGRYKLALGILDPWKNQPAVAFASQLSRIQGWTVLSAIEIDQLRRTHPFRPIG